MPYTDPTLEEAIVSNVLREPSALARVSLALEPNDFSVPSLGELYGVLVAMAAREQPIDTHNVAKQLVRHHLRHVNGSKPMTYSDALRYVASVWLGPAESLTLWPASEVERQAQVLAAERARERNTASVAALGRQLASDPAVAGAVSEELERLSQPAERKRLRVLSHHELVEAAKRDVTTRYLCGPMLRRGDRTMVLGPTGQGKTTLTWRMVAAALNGHEWLQPEWRGSPSAQRVLVLDVEQNEEDISAQLTECGLLNDERVTVVSEPDGLELGTNERQRREIDVMLGDLKPDILVVDPVYKLHRLENPNDEAQVVTLMRILDAWRSKHKVAIVMPMHTRKLPSEDVMRRAITTDDAAGSSAFTRGAEVIVGLRMVQHGYSLLWHLKDRRSKLPVLDKWGLIYDAEHGYWRDQGKGQPQQDIAERVRIALLQAEMPPTVDELCAQVEGSERAVRKALDECGAEKVGKEGRRDLWALPERVRQSYPDDPDDPENVF